MSHRSYKQSTKRTVTLFKILFLWLQKLSLQKKKLNKLYWTGVARLYSFRQDDIVQWVFIPRNVCHQLLMVTLPHNEDLLDRKGYYMFHLFLLFLLAFYALWQRTLKKLRTLKKIFQSALNLGPDQRTLKKFFKVR